MKAINGATFKELLKSGYANLSNNQKTIDTLNVFPVPDGDTGTNMTMTFSNGLKDALNVPSDSIGDVAKALSKGLLMGARGNSGVITSQIFRGFYQAVKEKDQIDVSELAQAFENGAKVAYKAIMKPVEGTILTVIREASWYAKHYFDEHPDIEAEEYLEKLVFYAEDSLNNTPELLPILKEVGVVDSGGTGLLKILEGFKACLDGHPITEEKVTVSEEKTPEIPDYGYNVVFKLLLNDPHHFNEAILKDKLRHTGENLRYNAQEGIIYIDVHSLKPGEILNVAQRYGEFADVVIKNLALKDEEVKTKAPKKPYGIIAVAAGEGLKQLFLDCRADIVIAGGQTMNPSTESFVEEIKHLNADHILILPNNSNIIMAAQQAKSIMNEQDITVLHTTSIQEGISALSMFSPDAELKDNLEAMNEAIANVQSGSITYAIKDTTFADITVKEGDYIGMTDKKIVASGNDKLNVIKTTLDVMMQKEDAELLTLIAGEGSSEAELAELVAYVKAKSDLEVETIIGDQPVYAYLIGVE